MKIVITVVVILLTMMAILASIYYYKTSTYCFKNYLLKNPDKFSLLVSINNETTISHNSEKPFVLASTMKLIVLLEYAIQLNQKLINENEKIYQKDLDVFFIPELDKAHESWRKTLKLKNDILLKDIVDGMILYSSNTCTDYLIDKLSIEKINDRIDTLNLFYHDKFMYISALYFMDHTTINDLDYPEFLKIQKDIVSQLKESKLDKTFENVDFDSKIEILLKKAPKSTTKDYNEILKQIIENKYSSEVSEKIMKTMNW